MCIYVCYLLSDHSTFSEVLSRTDLQLLLLLVPQQVLVLIFFWRWTSSFQQTVLTCWKVSTHTFDIQYNISIYLSIYIDMYLNFFVVSCNVWHLTWIATFLLQYILNFVNDDLFFFQLSMGFYLYSFMEYCFIHFLPA